MENQIKKYKYLIITGIVIIAGLFYWYEYRPSQIKKECAKKYMKFILSESQEKDANAKYESCLKLKGL